MHRLDTFTDLAGGTSVLGCNEIDSRPDHHLEMLLLIAIMSVGVPMLAVLLIFLRLREYRTDISRRQSAFEGRSRNWQANVLSPSNYTADGRRLLRWYVGALVLELIGFVVAFVLISHFLA